MLSFTKDQIGWFNTIPNTTLQRALRNIFATLGESSWSEGPQGAPGNPFTKEHFEVQPIFAKKLLGGAATGVAGDENMMLFERNMFEYHIIGTQTITVPGITANGLNLEMDNTATDGVEVTQGILARNRLAFTVGEQDFYFKCKVKLQDVSDTADCAMGFRKAEDYQAAIDNYDEMAAFNVISGDIKIETIDNNAATVTTDTTDNWADLAEKTLEVHVSKDRYVTYSIDGASPTVLPTVAFRFDAGEVVVPFFYFVLAVDGTCDCEISEWEVGIK